MGCFFGCFRSKESNANPVTPSEVVAPCRKNALSSLFLTDDDSLPKGQKTQNQLSGELDVRELKDEAKFLKACGTLPETPLKVKKALEKWEGISAPNEVQKSSKFNSWVQNASIEKLKLENQSDESPMPVKICEEVVTRSGCLMDSPSSCITEVHHTEKASSSSMQRSVQIVNTPTVMCDSEAHSEISSVSTNAFATSTQCKKKSVSFDYEPHRPALSSQRSLSESVSQHSKQCGSAGTRSIAKPSPYPTPQTFTQDMQTSGNMFPGSRLVNSFLDSARNPSQRNELKDESSDSHHPSESVKLNDEDNLMPTPGSDLSVREEMKSEDSLSSWLKPLSAKQDDNNKRFSENVYRRKLPADRPIIGMVAAHWNDDETSHIPPKWWDGNGIPNSTNKYKEDQKVSWHATPFEERLEKALSEETLISQRKPINRAPQLELSETEESDTAISHLQPTANLKSVVSF